MTHSREAFSPVKITQSQIGDLLGTSFLAFSFLVLECVQDNFTVSLESNLTSVEMENVTVATHWLGSTGN